MESGELERDTGLEPVTYSLGMSELGSDPLHY